jgi:predicted permease
MKAARRWLRRLAGTFVPGRAERDLQNEIDSHIELHVDDAVRRGVSPAEARRQAILAFGPIEATKERYRDRAGFPLLRHLAQDARFTGRVIRRTPLLTAAIVGTIAGAIAVNAVVFSVFNAAALQPLRVPDGARLVTLAMHVEGPQRRGVRGMPSMLSYPEFIEVRDHAQVFDGVGAFSPFHGVTLGTEAPRTAGTTLASCNFFEVIGVRPALGRGFIPADCAPDAPAAVVLADALWRSAFHADPSVVGQSVSINRTPFVVAGVLPPGFTGPQVEPDDLFVPLSARRTIEREAPPDDSANVSWLAVIAHRRPGVGTREIDAELGVVSARLTNARRDGNRYSLSASRLTLAGPPEIRSIVFTVGTVITVAVLLVLLIACANVANLLLSRASGRRHEMAIRLAIGAGRGRLIQQLLTESLLLALAGGLAGYFVGTSGAHALTVFLLNRLPPGFGAIVFDPQPDWRVAAYAAALTLLTGLTFGLAPALRATRRATLGIRESTSGAREGRRIQSVLVGTQVAVSSVLLIAACLLARGLHRAQTIDPGLSLERVSVVSYDLRAAGYSDASANAFDQSVIERLAALPGVSAVTQASVTPLSGQHQETGFTLPETGTKRYFEFCQIGPHYFDVLSVPIVRGRAFTADEFKSESAAMVTESTARRLWPGEDPLTKHVALDNVDLPIVGVVRDAQFSNLGSTDGTFLFLPVGPSSGGGMKLLVRGAAAAPSPQLLRRTAQSLDPAVAVKVSPLVDNLEEWRAPSRVASAIAAVLAFVSIVLAATGVFATVAYAVSRRTREIGIRIALGADRGGVLRLIVRQGLLPVAVGLGVGLIAAAAVSTVLASMLFGISPHDPLAFGSVSLAIGLLSTGACWVPARRALRVEPTIALRET